MHEGAEVEPDLRPKRLVVRLEDDPLGPAVKRFLDEERHPPHRNVFPLGGEPVAAFQGARAPNHAARSGHSAQAIDA